MDLLNMYQNGMLAEKGKDALIQQLVSTIQQLQIEEKEKENREEIVKDKKK